MGRALLTASLLEGHASWGSTPEPFKAQMRHAYAVLLLSAPPAPPPSLDEVRRLDTCWSNPNNDHKPPVQFVPVSVRTLLTVSPNTDTVVLARLGDKLHGWDICTIYSSLNLEGPALNLWPSHYASNRHLATYLCHLLNVPVPTTERLLHNFGTYFEFCYLTRSFRRDYLNTVFGATFANTAVAALARVA